jgi:thiaminase
MLFSSPMRLFCQTTRMAVASSFCLLAPSGALAYKYIHPSEFSIHQSSEILKSLGANDSLLKVNRVVSDKMTEIIASDMVQGMAMGMLTQDEWNRKYMRADALYIYRLGQELAIRAKYEKEADNIMVIADMFLGYGKHFDRLKRYGLSATDTLVCPECDEHIEWLCQGTSIKELNVAILTDMIPYVVFANYLLNSIEPEDQNPWLDYAKKYGDLNNKYAKEKLGITIQIANKILANQEISEETAEKLFDKGFSFEAWFIRNAFTKGFTITPFE